MVRIEKQLFSWRSGATALLVVTLPLLLALGSAGGQEEQTLELVDVGFAGPESTLHLEDEDVYLVSNVNGSPAAADGNGFISRVSPEGEVVELRWIDGESAEIELDAPKGMAVANGTLYVADITNVRMFDLVSGEQTGSVAIEGASFLNDVTTAWDGGVFVTDTGVGADFQPTGSAAVHRVSPDGTVAEVIASEELGMPNGITVNSDGTLTVVTLSDPGRILTIADGEISESLELEEGMLDGVVELENGDLLVSAWSLPGVIRVSDDGTVTTVVEGLASPADIDFDNSRQRLLIPLLQENQLHFVPLGQE